MSRREKPAQDGGQAYPQFTKQMRATHKLLVPQMAPIHFGMIIDVLRQKGYDVEILENDGPNVVHEGLQYVHNDACYPALLVIGQFIDALRSGRYDPDRVVLVISQTGGGCRASNYIHLLRKALTRAGFAQVPVVSLNTSNLERSSGLRLTPDILIKAAAACFFGDELMCLYNQVRPYELHPGDADRLVAHWQERIIRHFSRGRGRGTRLKKVFGEIARDFAEIPVKRTPKYKVGIVGEIYVKYSPLGNNRLEQFLIGEDCEINMPGLMGFVQYCIVNNIEMVNLYGGSRLKRWALQRALNYIDRREGWLRAAVAAAGFAPPGRFERTRELSGRFIGKGVKMGEGWLLTGEMAELIESGFPNIICAQPFGCLPNHIAGRGMIPSLRRANPAANITPLDYDPSATRVNQENRIKLMLATAEKTL